ncbi:MAG: hypothetical protein H0W34_04835 [Pyrinomonadaceae bacterium]|nr:hypothetical protein [Pyrinomonadaceae bacterium]
MRNFPRRLGVEYQGKGSEGRESLLPHIEAIRVSIAGAPLYEGRLHTGAGEIINTVPAAATSPV